MREKLIEVKHILDTKVINGFLIKNKRHLKLYVNTECQRRVKNGPYIYKSVKNFLKEGEYSDLIINDLGKEIYIDKLDW